MGVLLYFFFFFSFFFWFSRANESEVNVPSFFSQLHGADRGSRSAKFKKKKRERVDDLHNKKRTIEIEQIYPCSTLKPCPIYIYMYLIYDYFYWDFLCFSFLIAYFFNSPI